MSRISDRKLPDPIAESSPQQRLSSCRTKTALHELVEDPRQRALMHLAQAQAALQQWRSVLEAEGVLYGAIHTYPQGETTRYNYYPPTPNAQGKRRRIYVSQDNLAGYRADIKRGQQCQQLQEMEAQIVTLMQSARSLA